MTNPEPEGTAVFLAELRRCGTAEEFFACLDVAYDPYVLNVNRLHILRYFAGQLPGLWSLDGSDTQAVREAYRQALRRSYEAFVTGTATDHRLFKVLRDHAPTVFIPIGQVTVHPGGNGRDGARV